MGYKNVQHYRHTVHLYLDPIWRLSSNKPRARDTMYKTLSVKMSLPIEKTHVSMFTRAQCKQAIAILRPMYIQLFGKDLEYTKSKGADIKIMYTLIKSIKIELKIDESIEQYKLTVYCKQTQFDDSLNLKDEVSKLIDTQNNNTFEHILNTLITNIPNCYKVELDDMLLLNSKYICEKDI